jgi:hypothetical protein
MIDLPAEDKKDEKTEAEGEGGSSDIIDVF